MFCAIRLYQNCTDIKELKKRIEEELLPAIRDMEGYRSYMVVDCGDDDEVASISLFDTQQQAEQANDQVRQIVQSSLADLVPESPVVSVGEVIIENRR